MHDDRYFMDILDMCASLDVEQLECLITNINTMIENKLEEEEYKYFKQVDVSSTPIVEIFMDNSSIKVYPDEEE